MSARIRAYALGRLGFGVAALALPERVGGVLAGPGGQSPDARAFLRGIAGRELGLGSGLLLTAGSPPDARPWLLASACADLGDVAGVLGSWTEMAGDKRAPGLALAGAAALTGLLLAVGSSANK